MVIIDHFVYEVYNEKEGHAKQNEKLCNLKRRVALRIMKLQEFIF